jgi:hypothetical protein
MTNEELIALIQKTENNRFLHLSVFRPTNTVGFAYLTEIDSSNRPIIGGYGWLVNESDHSIKKLSASIPLDKHVGNLRFDR